MGSQVAIIDRAETEFLNPIIEQIRSQLPDTITEQKFKSAFIIAVQTSPDILKCEISSVRNALIRCASDGLVPDGRLAAIIPFRDRSLNALIATYMPMVQGIIRRAYEMGETFAITCECVYEKDEFTYDRGGIEAPKHVAPPLGTDRGNIVGAYAIFRDRDLRPIHVEIMDRKEIDKTRAASKAKDGPMWSQWFGEAGRKTVIRRGSKYIPMSDAMRRIVEREDEHFQFDGHEKLAPGKNPLLADQINGVAFSYDDLLPGIATEYAKALGVTESAPTFTKADTDFWKGKPDLDIPDEENEKVKAVWKANVDRIKKAITLAEFYDQLKAIIGIQESGAQAPVGEGTPRQDNSEKSESIGEQPSTGSEATTGSSPPAPPKNAAEYALYAGTIIKDAKDGKVLGDWWKSDGQVALRKSCKFSNDQSQAMKQTVLQRIEQLKPEAV